MRIINFLVLFLVLLGVGIFMPVFCLAQAINPDFKQLADGTYEGSYKQDAGKADVEVVIKNGRIESVTPIKHWYYGRRRIAQTIGQRIVEQQQTRVDAVTGVTVTSVAVMKAVENALEKAVVKDDENIMHKPDADN